MAARRYCLGCYPGRDVLDHGRSGMKISVQFGGLLVMRSLPIDATAVPDALDRGALRAPPEPAGNGVTTRYM
ncbi:hypothetical protein PJP10_22250 [Mycobacterium kansasii]|nr:hypothetical protein MKSMC1_05080 [Mycobacterium kansasii]